MASGSFTPEQLRELRQLAARWAKIVSQRAFGDTGPGLEVGFRTMEQVAQAAAQGVTEGTLQLLLQQQADQLPDQQPCPDCGELCPVQPSARPLVAQGATITQAEPLAHCPDCRRDFFPPPHSAGAG